MTNEVVAVGAQVGDLLARECSRGQEVVNGAWAWVAEKGAAFAVDVVVAVLIFVVGAFAVKLATAAARVALRKSGHVNELLEKFLCSVVSKTGWILVVLMAMERLGMNVGPLVAGLGVTGFILGFAFQETLGNFASGIMIALNQPFKVGDYVVADGVEGTVLELNMMATVLATADNKKVVVANKAVWASAITNFSALGKRRVDTTVGIAYGEDVSRAIGVALKAVGKVPGVLADPPPVVIVASLDDSAVTLNVRPWANCADYWNVYSDVQMAVKAAFDGEGISIPFPQMDVHLDK